MKLSWRQGVLYVTIMGMEWGWLYALLFLLNERLADRHLSIIGLWLLYPLAFILNKPLQRRRWSNIYLYPVNGLALIIGILLVMKIQLYSGLGLFDPAWLQSLLQALAQTFQTMEPEVLILGSSIILWWLGCRLARLKVTFATSVTEFQFGLAILLIVCLVASQLGVQLANTIPLTFFLFALMGMALAHAQDSASWSIRTNRGLWTWLLLASIGLVLFLGISLSSVVTADLVQLILIPLKWIWSMIEKGVELLASLFPVSDWGGEPPPAALPPSEIPAEEFPKLMRIPEQLLRYLRLGYNFLWLGIILFALWRVSSLIFGWLRRRLMTTAGAEIEPLPGAFRADLLSFFKRILRIVLRLRFPFWRQRKPKHLPPEITSVHQIYHQLLHWVATGGWPRPAFQTPYEYLYTLEELLPASKDALRFITEQYVSSRYGLSSPTEAELRQLRQSWHQVRHNRLSSEHTHD
ncbi:hypothetical protein ES703_19482 [subsurface metagenome]